jgi:hypothetical protein
MVIKIAICSQTIIQKQNLELNWINLSNKTSDAKRRHHSALVKEEFYLKCSSFKIKHLYNQDSFTITH